MKLGLIKIILSLCVAIPFSLMYDGVMIPIVLIAAFLISWILWNVIIWLFIFLFAAISKINPNGKRLSRVYGFILNTAYCEVCSLSRIKVKVIGKEKIPDEPYLIVANHRSNFDNFILSSIIKNPKLVYISKPSNFIIPFAGALIRRCGYLAIDRENPRNALKTIHASAELIKNDKACVGVFPEGTRGHSEGVADFSEGCFLVAKKAACPVVCVSLSGTDSISKRFPRKTVVTVNFIDVIPVQKISESRSGEISEIAYAMIASSYAENRIASAK